MPETFLILLAAGMMLAAAISDPRAVTLRWLRLAGVNALWITALAGFFVLRRQIVPGWPVVLIVVVFLAILAQLALVQTARRESQRVMSWIAVVTGMAAGCLLIPQARSAGWYWSVSACVLAGAGMGLALMDMLLGHAYLNAAEMTMTPFLRLNRALAGAIGARALLSVGGTLFLQSRQPIDMFWGYYGLYIGTRWLVGFVVAGIFVWMTHDCIKRRATQSATGILYVAGVLIFIGEMIGLYLVSETGMPL